LFRQKARTFSKQFPTILASCGLCNVTHVAPEET
jgi:hypothetical protein